MNDILDALGTLFHVAILPTSLIALAMWNADKVLSAEGAALLYRSIAQTAATPADSPIEKELQQLLGKYFSYQRGVWTLLRSVLILTLCSMGVLLCIYTYKTPGLAGQLSSEGFLSQFFGDGFLKTYLVNWFAFSVYSLFIREVSAGSAARSMTTIVMDITFKMVLFIALTAIIYVIFAESRDAFGGKWQLALNSIRTTLLFAIQFKDLTAVYFYSVVISSFPIFVVALITLMSRHAGFSSMIRGVLFFLPFKDKPLRATSVVFAIFSGLVALIVAVLLAPLSA